VAIMTTAGRWADRVRAWSRRPAVQDAALAAALLAACAWVNSATLTMMLTGPAGRSGVIDVDSDLQLALWWTTSVLAAVAVALRRRWPIAMLAVCTVVAAVHLGQAVPFTIIDLAVPILLGTVATRHGRGISLAILAWLLLLVVGWSLYSAANALPVPGVPVMIDPQPRGPGIGGPKLVNPVSESAVLQNTWAGTFVLGSVLVASWATGAGVRSRRAYLDQLHARAQDLERERDQEAALAVAAERGRISRELHDVVAHGLSVMVTQAQGAAASLDNRPAETRTALDAIVKTGRDSLADMRRVLSRVDGVDDAWHPQPGLDRLPELIAQVTSAGTPVRTRVEGTPSELPPAVDLSAYRIVQEALTNTMKHAGPGATADVVLRYYDAELTLEIRDDGRGPVANDGTGNGLRGMHERVRLLGGHLHAGAGPTGGYLVHAVLPIEGPQG
jgi:signal transduction histidine kinase